MNDWAKRLRHGLGNQDCRLPTGLTFAGAGAELTIRLGERALIGNMQEDGAAFEAWALACLVHCGVERVTLEIPALAADAEIGRHSQRLLYRLNRFCDLFPDAVRVAGASGSEWSYATHPRLVLNQPLSHRRPPADHRSLMASLKSSAKARESQLEFALEVSPAFRAAFGLDKVMRQWPVGLFRGQVAAASHVFTGGKSAIDLVGLRGSTLLLFELKRDGNAKAGIVSELLFYASVLRDALGENPRFEFEPAVSPRNCCIGPTDLRGCDAIEAVMLAPRFHPVVTPQVIQRLNGALAQIWNKHPIRIRAVPFTISEGDFEFATPNRWAAGEAALEGGCAGA